MKKLLIFILILGLASVAQGALSLLVSDSPGGPWEDVSHGILLFPSETIWIGVHNDTDGIQYDFYMEITGPGSWTGNVSYAGYPYHVPAAYATVYPKLAYGSCSYPGIYPGLVAGVGLDFEFYREEYYDITIELYDSAAGLVDTLFITVPEPLTLAFLALGGTALLRRRRR